MKLLLRAAALLVILVSMDMPAHGQAQLEAAIDETLTVGNDPSLPTEYLLGRPKMVRTDDQGRIYIADSYDMTVKVYDEDGQPVRLIGGRGEAPGEFQRFSAMHVDMKGLLIVADHFQRRVTVFSPEGEVLETYSVEDSINWPRYLDQLPSGEFLFVFEMPEELRPGSGPSPLIHLFDGSFEHLTSFGRQDRIAPSEHAFMRHRIGFRPGNLAVGPNGDVVFVSDLYQGKLFRFREQDGQWQLVQTHEGVVRQPPAYTPVEVPNLADYEERPDYPDGVDLIHVRRESYGARIHNQSKELFFDSDGRIVHFTFIRDGNRRAFGVELFDQQGNLLGYAPIGTYTTTRDGRTVARFEIGWQDSEDRFYILDYREQPVVRVVTIDWEGADKD